MDRNDDSWLEVSCAGWPPSDFDPTKTTASHGRGGEEVAVSRALSTCKCKYFGENLRTVPKNKNKKHTQFHCDVFHVLSRKCAFRFMSLQRSVPASSRSISQPFRRLLCGVQMDGHVSQKQGGRAQVGRVPYTLHSSGEGDGHHATPPYISVLQCRRRKKASSIIEGAHCKKVHIICI